MSMKNGNLIPSWSRHLAEEFSKPYMKKLDTFLEEEKEKGKIILPPEELWFSALNSTSLESVNVVILGQDPYPTIGHAHGLCFSLLPEVKPLAKSLLNINKELLEDVSVDNSNRGCLQAWAEQGVLLLNAIFTVEAGCTNAHAGKGWELFTDKIIELVNRECENVVFILWGAYAQKKGKIIDETKHLILKSPHPSPLSAYRGFFGSQPFSKTNSYLDAVGKETIDWQL